MPNMLSLIFYDLPCELNVKATLLERLQNLAGSFDSVFYASMLQMRKTLHLFMKACHVLFENFNASIVSRCLGLLESTSGDISKNSAVQLEVVCLVVRLNCWLK